VRKTRFEKVEFEQLDLNNLSSIRASDRILLPSEPRGTPAMSTPSEKYAHTRAGWQACMAGTQACSQSYPQTLGPSGFVVELSARQLPPVIKSLASRGAHIGGPLLLLIVRYVYTEIGCIPPPHLPAHTRARPFLLRRALGAEWRPLGAAGKVQAGAARGGKGEARRGWGLPGCTSACVHPSTRAYAKPTQQDAWDRVT